MRLIYFILTLFLISLFSGCGSSDSSKETPSNDISEEILPPNVSSTDNNTLSTELTPPSFN